MQAPDSRAFISSNEYLLMINVIDKLNFKFEINVVISLRKLYMKKCKF
jgi:hypothetical protein